MVRASNFLGCFGVLLVLLAAGCAEGPRVKSAAAPSRAESGAGAPADVLALLQKRLSWTGVPFRVVVSKEMIRAEYVLPRFYKLRGYRAAWLGPHGPLPLAQALLRAIRASEEDGFSAATFHLVAIQTLLEDVDRRRQLDMTVAPEVQVDLELLLTDAFLTLGRQLQFGRVKPKLPGYEWFIPQTDRRDLLQLLEQAIETGQIEKILHEQLPAQGGYVRLRAQLAEYRAIAKAGGWPVVTPGPSLHKGDRDKRVALLRRRLLLSHDLPEASKVAAEPRLFDDALEAALKRFQERHGLSEDGVLGGGSIPALNVSVQKRIRQIALNMERWRWLPRELGRRYLAVNIANFSLRIVEDDRAILTMPVVVGTQYRHTPVFTGLMTHVILNPSWFVPKKLAVEDLLPKLKKDPAYLEKHGFSALRKKPGGKWVEVAPAEIDWSTLDEESFDLTLRQNSGPNNALGRVKFIFDNPFNVYLHDTPAKELFKKRIRTYSSGCIRLGRPLDLVRYLFPADSTWKSETAEKKLVLPEPIAVHILYETSWVDGQGVLNFRPDLYGRDELLDQFL